MARSLRYMAREGIQVEFFAVEDACPACRTLAGQVFDAHAAPTIPVEGCQGEHCRCDYLPVTPPPPRPSPPGVSKWSAIKRMLGG